MSDKINYKRMLDDLASELDGQTISDTFSITDTFNFTMHLLNEEESNWRNAHTVPANRLSIVSSFRMPTVAISTRAINDIPVNDFFEKDWEELSEAQKELYGNNEYARKYFNAENLMQWISQRMPDSVEILYNKYKTLEKRREEAQAALKKSQGENSEQNTETPKS